MKRGILSAVLFLLCVCLHGQVKLRGLFPKSAVNVQYAGSTGLATIGLFKASKRDKIELGILYGYLPGSFGGPNHTLSLKFLNNPF